MSLPSPDGLQVVLTLSTVAAIWLGWVKVVGPKIKPAWRRLVGTFQTLAGRDAIIDKVSGREVSPAVKPIGEHLSLINDTMAKLVVVIESNQNAHQRIDNVVGDVSLMRVDVDALKLAAAERIVTKDESAQMWRAVANADADLGESTDET